MPKLQVLELYGVLPTAHSSLRPASTAVHPVLPLLRELHLGGTTQGVLAVLKALNLPERVTVYVSLPDAPTVGGSSQKLLAKLSGKQGTGPEPSHTSH